MNLSKELKDKDHDFPVDKCVQAIELIESKFEVGFVKFHDCANEMWIFQNPFEVDVLEVP